MKVGDVMSHPVHTCSPADSLNRAAQIMWDNDCGCVPIVDGDGKAIAMITDRDVCMAGYTQGRPLTELMVSSAASRELVTVRATDSVETAEMLMRKHKIRRLPVVDAAGRPVGIFSMNDLARHAHDMPRSMDGLNAESVVGTLASICEPAPAHAIAAE